MRGRETGGFERKSPYHGCWVVCLLLSLPPLFLYFLLRLRFAQWSFDTIAVQKAECMTFAAGIGFVVGLCFAVGGGLKKPFRAVKNRLADFFSDLSISADLAFSGYADSFVGDGAVFWIYLALILLNLYFTLRGISQLKALHIL